MPLISAKMKKIFLLFSLSLLLSFTTFAGEVKGFFNYNIFNTPTNQPFLETYLTVAGNSVVFTQLPNGKYQGKVEISIGLYTRDSVYAPRKYFLLSPEIDDTSKRPNFIDQQRINIAEGAYALEMILSDPNSKDKKKFTVIEKVEVSFPKDKINISDIQLVESFKKTATPSVLSKSGYDLIPYPINYYPDDMTRLAFYCEAYNSAAVLGKDTRFAFFYYVENFHTREKVGDFAGFSKQNGNEVNVLLSQLDVTKLRSGYYNLVVEVKDQNANIISQKKVFFERRSIVPKSELSDLSSIVADSTFISNVKSADTLEEYIRCLWPISSTSERDYAMNQWTNKDVKQMQKYIYGFWKNKNPNDPEGEWLKYKKQVDIVNKIFAAGKRQGYSTDRGRVYLQYGTPDSRQEYLSEPNTYPYEIWQYYRIVDPATGQMQTNKRFVFFNNDMAGNNYELIHSEVRGERYDTRWKLKIMKRTVQSNDLDFENPVNPYGTNIDDNFKMPK